MKYGDSFYHIFTSGYNYTILSGENQVSLQRFPNCSQKGGKGAEKGLFNQNIKPFALVPFLGFGAMLVYVF